jgi:hypothetical protein
VKTLLKVVIVWMTLLAVPLQGFASATMSLCAPPPAAARHDHDHDHASTAGSPEAHAHAGHARPAMQTDHHAPAHHHSGKCASCATCGSCVSMAPSFPALLPASASPSSIYVSFDQRILPSADLALPERPPRA